MNIQKIKEQLEMDPEVRNLIGERAFELYLARRGTGRGNAAEDWLRAESQILPALINQMVEANRNAIESHDSSDPTMLRAAEQMENQLEAEAVQEASAPPVKKTAAKKSAAAKKSPAKAAEKPAPKAEAKKPAAAKDAPPKESKNAAAKKPAARKPKSKE